MFKNLDYRIELLYHILYKYHYYHNKLFKIINFLILNNKKLEK